MEEEEEVLLSAGKEVSAHWKELPGQRGFGRLSELNPALGAAPRLCWVLQAALRGQGFVLRGMEEP